MKQGGITRVRSWLILLAMWVLRRFAPKPRWASPCTVSADDFCRVTEEESRQVLRGESLENLAAASYRLCIREPHLREESAELMSEVLAESMTGTEGRTVCCVACAEEILEGWAMCFWMGATTMQRLHQREELRQLRSTIAEPNVALPFTSGDDPLACG